MKKIAFHLLVLATSALAYIPNFHAVSEDLLRGGRPRSYEDLEWLKKRGVKTILNLENRPEAVAKEKEWAKKLGLKFYSTPMDWDKEPSDSMVDGILANMTDSKLTPVFVHCYHGKDRAGLIVALYRVIHQGWKPDEAYEEMLDKGFNPEFTALAEYFEKKAGNTFPAFSKNDPPVLSDGGDVRVP